MDTNVTKQLIYLVHQNTGIKLEKVIEQILISSIYHTNEIFQHPNIQELNQIPGKNKHYNTLELFTYSNYSTYKKNPDNFLQLSQTALKKLKILTIIDMAKDKKTLLFDELNRALDLSDSFELDNILFEAISSGLISGKVDQFKRIVKVNNLFTNKKILHLKGRDYITNRNEVEEKFEKWIKNLEVSERYINNQIQSLKKDKKDFNDSIAFSVNQLKKISNINN